MPPDDPQLQDLLADWPAQRARHITDTQQKENPMTNWNDILAKLAAPFPTHAIKYRVGALSKDGTKAKALPYADVRTYEDRLNAVVPGEWSVDFEPWGENRIICKLTIRGITRSATGEAHDNPANITGMAAEARALKRACSKFGLGRYLYDLPTPWVDHNPRTHTLSAPPPKAAATRSRIHPDGKTTRAQPSPR